MAITRSIGIRLPVELWDLVKAVDPDLTYSEIVRRALLEVYDIEEVDLDKSILKPEVAISATLKPAVVEDIRNIIDSWEVKEYE